jgi:hypothetical protein
MTAAEYKTGNIWDHFAISNITKGSRSMASRLWVTAIFGYVFAAYFCQLLYAEYNNFSVRRLQYLVQADPDGPDMDPDTPPQKYFTVMIESIPGHLRSAKALRDFFERLFPGDVYTVEIALDLKELDEMNAKRKRVSYKYNVLLNSSYHNILLLFLQNIILYYIMLYNFVVKLMVYCIYKLVTR